MGVCVCVLAACQCSAVPGSAVRAGGPVQSHPAPPADSIQRQNPGTPAEPGHAAGRHLQPGQKKTHSLLVLLGHWGDAHKGPQ